MHLLIGLQGLLAIGEFARMLNDPFKIGITRADPIT